MIGGVKMGPAVHEKEDGVVPSLMAAMACSRIWDTMAPLGLLR